MSLDERPEALPPRQHLASRDRHRRVPPQLGEPGEVVRRQRLLEPDHVVGREHLRRPQRPLVPVRPERVAAAGVHHQLDPGSDRVAGRPDQQLVGLLVPPAERLPPQLDRPEPAADRLRQLPPQRVRLVEQQRPVRLDPVAVDAAEQPGDGLAGELAEEVPQGDVDAADGVLDGPAAALPERVLAEPLRDARRLVGPLAGEQRPQEPRRRGDQRRTRVRSADADEPLVGDHLDDGVDVVLGNEFLGPPALDGPARQPGEAEVGDCHDELRSVSPA